jgi:hypothetical protein
VEQIPNLFWLSVLIWAYAEMATLIRFVLLELKEPISIEELVKDRSLIYYKTVSVIAVNVAAVLGSVIIGVSISNIIGL